MSAPAQPPARSAPAHAAPARPAPIRSARRLAIGVCLLAALVYLLTYAGVLHAVDEQSALSVAESMLFGQGFHVNQMAWDQGRTPPQNAFGLDGNLYSKKGIGVSLAALPLFALGKLLTPGVGAVQVALLAGTLLTVLSVWAFWGLARSLGYRPRVAAVAALLLALGSPLWPYARTLLSETPGAAGLALALWGMAAWRRAAPARRVGRLLPAGVGLALLVLVKSSNGVVAPIFGLYWLWGVWEQRRGYTVGSFFGELAALSAPVILAAAGTVAYNYVRFGTTLGFPLEPFEAFSTPLYIGLAGLLLSPGKGIFWYFPALWLGVIFLPHWRRGGRLADWLLAAGSALAIIVLYALWYDWPGGRAWGPRMIISAVPALAMLTLPALDWLLGPHADSDDLHRAERHADSDDLRSHSLSPTHPLTRSPAHPLIRSLAIALLTLSFAVQLPGALVNFERQEELDMQAGATFDQLLWSPAHSPLLTYWARITTTPDPLWLQPYVRALPQTAAGSTGRAWPAALGEAALGAAVLCLLAAVAGLIAAARRSRRGQSAARPLALAAAALLLLLPLLPLLGRTDPRWDDQSAVREDNQAMMQSITAEGRGGDLVLLDLLPSSDKGRRSGQWLNFADQPYIGWLRTPAAEMGGEAGARLTDWLAPYRCVWLLLQATDEGDPTSTTEAWLNGWAYAGRRWWVGDQRVAEYLLPLSGETAGATGVETAGPFDFGGAAVLQSYRLEEDADGVRLLLRWQDAGDADIRYSVQALGPGGVLAQVDGQPAPAEDRVGLALPPGVERLILKLYRAADGGALPVSDPAVPGQPAAEFLPLARP